MATAVTSADPIMTREDVGKLLLRLAVGLLMLLHGIAKIQNGIGWMSGVLGSVGLPAFVGYGVYVGEVIAPILLVAGFYTRIAALGIAFDMVAAILLVQRDKIFALNQGGGWAIELEMLYMLGAIAIFFLGSGRYAASKGRGRWN